MSDENERSVGSAGSVAGGPVAWAVTLADGERIYDVYAIEEEAKAIDEAVTGNHGVVPLYRSPTLTDEERDTVWTVAEAYAGNDGDPECERLARVLQGIYQRLK
jgi:hypothetical protein